MDDQILQYIGLKTSKKIRRLLLESCSSSNDYNMYHQFKPSQMEVEAYNSELTKHELTGNNCTFNIFCFPHLWVEFQNFAQFLKLH